MSTRMIGRNDLPVSLMGDLVVVFGLLVIIMVMSGAVLGTVPLIEILRWLKTSCLVSEISQKRLRGPSETRCPVVHLNLKARLREPDLVFTLLIPILTGDTLPRLKTDILLYLFFGVSFREEKRLLRKLVVNL